MAQTTKNTQQSREYGQSNFVWWNGKVVDIDDPHKNGRLKVEIFGHYDGIDKEGLPWAIPLGMVISHSKEGIGFSPTGIDKDAIVFGFFYDGADGQTPVYIGSLYGKPGGEADTFKNAREEQDIEPKKLITGKKPDGGEFKEPDTEYEAKYPYNHTRKTKNGHIFELDDTEDKQRFHYRHPKGTDVEILKNGDMIVHGVKDSWHMMNGDIYIHTDKTLNISVASNANVNVGGNARINVGGNVKETIGGNYDLEIAGNFNTKVGGSITSTAGGTETRKASTIFLN